jgi:DNA primase
MILTYGRLPDIKYDPQTIEPMVRKEIRLPTNVPVLDLPENHPARQFLVKRGIDKDQLLCYDIRYGQGLDADFPTAYNSIIFPVYMEQMLASWQARVLTSNSRMKYYSCPGIRIHDLLYGWDLAKDYDYAILVEGVFDAIRIGPPALALFGKHVSDQQARLLQRFKMVFYIPDSDVPKDEIGRNIASLKIYRVKTVPVIMSQVEDPAELDPVDIQRMKEAFERMVSDGAKNVH